MKKLFSAVFRSNLALVTGVESTKRTSGMLLIGYSFNKTAHYTEGDYEILALVYASFRGIAEEEGVAWCRRT